VPRNVTKIQVTALGADGAGGWYSAYYYGGRGGQVSAAISVAPHERLVIFVGGHGSLGAAVSMAAPAAAARACRAVAATGVAARRSPVVPAEPADSASTVTATRAETVPSALVGQAAKAAWALAPVHMAVAAAATTAPEAAPARAASMGAPVVAVGWVILCRAERDWR
jgi:hypothetical protein